jgi:hypothetical protein
MDYDDNITAHHVLESRQKKAFLETPSGIPPDISVPDPLLLFALFILVFFNLSAVVR